MKEAIQVRDYAGHIMDMLPKGLLLNTVGEKFNSMIIGWGDLGRLWSRPSFLVYVRDSRYTKAQLDAAGEFTVSVPMEKPDPEIVRICGSLSGRDIDKAEAAHLTLEEPELIRTPGIREFPLTLECRILYSQKMDHTRLPQEIQDQYYPPVTDDPSARANHDDHTLYAGEIVCAYMIR